MAVYAAGSFLTAISWSVGALMVGWSVIEGLGAALVLPALLALVAENYHGKERAVAYGVMGGIAGAGVAVGPIVGGWVTTYLSWRVVFGAEVVVAALILATLRWVGENERTGQPPKIDYVGSALSATGLGALVLGIVQSSKWGWVKPKQSPIEPLGFSLTLYVLIAGVALVYSFIQWERHRARIGADPLVDLSLLKIPPLRAGLITALTMQLVLMGIFFANPLYLQIVQGYNAFETGVRMLPVSVMLFVSSLAGARLASRFAPRTLIRVGFGTIFVSVVGLMSQIDPQIDTAPYLICMGVLGTGIGLVSSQIGNVTQSSVSAAGRSEVGGLQNTFAQFGSAVGTALIGAVVISGLSLALNQMVSANPAVSDPIKQQVGVAVDAGIPFVSTEEAKASIDKADLPADEAAALLSDYEAAELQALKGGLLVAALVTLAALMFTGNLPDHPLSGEESDDVAAAAGPPSTET